MIRTILIALALGCLATPAAAEVVSKSANAFTLRFAVGLETTPEDVIVTVGDLPKWWDPAHTYTGAAANLSLALEEAGCWCERLADGSIFEHAMVTAVEPQRVAMNAALGPLHDTATRSDLTFAVGPENRGWLVSMDFVVEGPGVGAYAEAVDGVMSGAWDRFIRYVEYGEAPATLDVTAD